MTEKRKQNWPEEPWIADVRTGMLAVYGGEPKNCLDQPAGEFIYTRAWPREAEGPAVNPYRVRDGEPETARRIVACVNALAGVRNPAAVPELVTACKARSPRAIREALDALDKEPTT